ncbi:MAG: response regulator [Lentisphaeria bacterium]|nr:response regulator [Lentisphaeria bacterium]
MPRFRMAYSGELLRRAGSLQELFRVPSRGRESFAREMTHENLVWMVLVLAGTMLWLSIHLIVDGFVGPAEGVGGGAAFYGCVVSACLVVACGVLLTIAALSWPRSPAEVRGIHGTVVLLGAGSIALWAGAVAGVESQVHNLSLALGLCVLITCFILHLPAWSLAVCMGLSLSSMVAMVHLLGAQPLSTLLRNLNLAGLLAFGILASRLVYATRIRSFVNAWRSADEIRRRKSLESALMSASRRLAEWASRADGDLRLSTERFQSLVRNSPDYILTLAADHRVLFCNRPIGGTAPEALVGRCWGDFLPGPARERVRGAVDRVFRERTTMALEHEMPGGVRWRCRLVPPVFSERTEEVILIGTDITEQRAVARRERELRERLLHAERLDSLGLLAGGVAHDLNNILGPVVGLPGVIRADLEPLKACAPESVETILVDLEVIQTSAIRASKIIEDLLALGRRGNYRMEPVDLHAVVQECLASADIQAAVRERGIACPACTPPPGRTLIRGSRSHVLRAVGNVVRNAVESCRDGNGRVTLETSFLHVAEPLAAWDGRVPPGDYVELTVRDNGIGIPAEMRKRIFEPFVSNKKQSGRSGSGLGLAIVHRIVQDHGGHILVDSEEGVGTTFRLLFRFLGAVESAEEDDDGGALVGGVEHVLVVEDDPAQRATACRMLRSLGYTVSVAANGREAVRLFAEQAHAGDSPYGVVVMDMVMEEDFDGLETLGSIRRLCPTQRLVVVSGFAQSERVLSAIALGAGWLPKPYDVGELADAVRDTLDRG